eukprot:TRINITY_DN31864_c1_g1_i1.p1 TRINITY_DN31864_c1_g1~~TRINITY_DN31864_c1_g1_i1.p1  ORF type:complete len:626 (+),score=100.11 TRINITY_DN31864_c1_g1_i1:269-1879(+)
MTFQPNPRGKNIADIYGLAEPGGRDTNPVLIFVRIRRNEFPDLNSFEEAHKAPFKRSDFFSKELWNRFDRAEAQRKAESMGNIKKSTYPCSWFVDLAPDGVALLRDLIMDRSVAPKDPSALKSIGEGLYFDSGLQNHGICTLWSKEHGAWSRMRGIWFDAFEELLVNLGLEMDRQSAWALFRRFSSTKEIPTVGFGGMWSPGDEPGGLVPVYFGDSHNPDEDMGIVNALEHLQSKVPFLSDATFLEFNRLSGLHMDPDIAVRLYNQICKRTPNYQGALNLVAWRDFETELREHIQQRTHQLEIVLQGEKEPTRFRVGGIWFEPLYNVVITCMPEVPAWSEVHEIYLSYVDSKTGLCPLSKVYDIITKLGRPGLKFEQFSSFINRLGMHVDMHTQRKCFQTVDIEQNNTLDSSEMKSGMNLLFRQMVPELILKQNQLQPEQIFFHVSCSLGILLLIFSFLELSFVALLGPNGGSKLNSALQSIIAAGVAVATQSRQNNNYDDKQLRSVVSSDLENYAGVAAARSVSAGSMPGKTKTD